MFIDIIAVVFTFGIIIFLHELGHFISALWLGVRVEKFSFGFGPEIVGITVKNTRYSICIFPLGGMVKLAGEYPEEVKGEQDEFFSQKWYRRILIAVSGPVMNYFLAVVFFFIVIFFWGMGIPSNQPVVGEVGKGMPAEKSGILIGDRIISVDGKLIKQWQDAAEIIHKKPNEKIVIELKRENKIIKREIIPELDKNFKVGLIGIMPEIKVEKVGIIKSAGMSVKYTVGISVVYITYIIDRIIKLEKPEIAGPIGIAQIVAQTARAGISSLFFLIGGISVMIALMNLFPIPLFDGGHILFSTIEGLITRKPISKKIIEKANFVGLVVIATIMIFAFYSDFERLGLFKVFQ